MDFGWARKDFKSEDEKIAYAKSVLSIFTGGSWNEDTKTAISEMLIDTQGCDSIIATFEMVCLAHQRSSQISKFRLFEEKRKLAKSGYVYLIQLFDNYYKIGRSSNPEARLAGIQSIAERLKPIERFSKIDPRLIHAIPSPDFHWAEKFLHSKFALARNEDLHKTCWESYGLTSEVFNLSQRQVEEICAIEELVPEWLEDVEL